MVSLDLSVVDAYTLVYGGCLLLGDVLGWRTVLLAGLVLFTPPSAYGNDHVPKGCVEPDQPDQESRSNAHEAGTNVNAVTCIESVKEA
jgi:hypothetical protein